MLNLAKAIKAYKKGANSRNTGLFEKEVEKFIKKQIKLKKEEIDSLKEALKEGKEEKFEDFKEGLVQLNESRIDSTSSRQSYASDYVIEAIATLETNKDWEDEIQDQINDLKAEIKELEDLESILSTITVTVEEETE